jgi:hydrolase, TatD family
MEIFDTHAHYDDSAFDGDRDSLLGEALPAAGVVGVVSCGTTVRSSRENAALAEKYGYLYFAAGIHPEDAESAGDGDMDRLAELIKGSKKAVAVGEIGLDYHCEVDRTLQRTLFERQLALARTLDLPVILHDRDAHGDMMEILRASKPRGVLHCFSGSAESAEELVALGFFIGFTGSVTFKNNKKAARVLEAVPKERIVVETDCPYMAPEPFRGRRCDSSMIARTLDFIADIKGLQPVELARITARNARILFELEE